MKNKMKITGAVKYGGLSLIITAAVLTAVIIVNLIVGALPADMTYITSESSDIYEISEASKKYMEELDQNVTVYIVAQQGASDEHYLMISRYVERYALLSDKITVKYVDPVLRPGFLSDYGSESYTSDELSASLTHLVIESEKRAKLIPYGELITTAYTGDELAEFYYTNGYIPYSFNAEGCLLGGIDYVTLEKIPIMYYTVGHGESLIDNYFNYILEMESVVYKSLDTKNANKIPDDAEALLIFAPTADFTAAETAMLKAYAKRGGNVVLISGYNASLTNRTLTNLYSFMEEEYGLAYGDVKVFEGKNGSFVSGNNDQIYPIASGALTKPLENSSVIMRNCHAIELSKDLPDGVTVTTILSTSDKGYTKTVIDKNTVMEKVEGDTEGKFILGAEAVKTVSGGKSKAFWFSSVDAVNIDGTYPYLANIYIPVYVVSESLSKIDPVSVQGISLVRETLEISDSAANIWSILLIGVLPAGIMAYGIYVVYRRKRR